MTDFLLELRSEEIPARMQDKAGRDLAQRVSEALFSAGAAGDRTEWFVTPRRLAVIVRDVPDFTEAVSEEIKGPRAGAPPQALEGFLRKTGLTADQLTDRDGVLYAMIDRPGRATRDVLAEAIPAIIRGFPWPKSMRWGAASISTESPRWVRPLHGIVALFGDDVVECEIAGVRSGAATLGHRFHHPYQITIDSAGDYEEKLRAGHVIVDQDERRAIIRDRAGALAAEAGLALIEDEGLVAENAGLTEWPVPLLGRFDAAFLDVPPEVIQLTARVNQKYFVCRDGAGKLANAFVCVANIDAADGGAAIVEGNRKVLAARLSDARFFYETDLKVPLEEQARKLAKIVFHEKLGTVADKVERVAKLARWLVEEGIVTSSFPGEGGGPEPSSAAPATLDPGLRGGTAEDKAKLADQAERAARLAKADLVTGMVGEFPELQGVMGGYYAAAQGDDAAVAEAIRDHYKPVGQGDDVPTAPVTVAVSLADKLDTLLGFFASRYLPTGSKDPFALRRAALSVIALIEKSQFRLSIRAALEAAYRGLATQSRLETLGVEQALGDDLGPQQFTFWTMEVSSVLVGEVVEQLVNFQLDFERPDWRDLRLGHSTALPVFGVPVVEDEWEKAAYIETYPSLNFLLDELMPFFADRLKVQQREAGVRHDLIDAVFALGGEDDLVRLLARVRALQAFVGTGDGANLLAGYKRAANILKKEGWSSDSPSPFRGEGAEAKPKAGEGQSSVTLPDTAPLPGPLPGGEREEKKLSYTPEPAETALIAALDAAEPAAAAAVQAEDFEAAMAALATLRAPIDAFFDSVTVNDPDADKRASRLSLLARVRDAVHGVADFSKIES